MSGEHTGRRDITGFALIGITMLISVLLSLWQSPLSRFLIATLLIIALISALKYFFHIKDLPFYIAIALLIAVFISVALFLGTLPDITFMSTSAK